MLQLCEVYDYTLGLIEKPNSLLDSQGARNWSKNDNHVSTPMDPKVKILPNPEGNEGSQSNYFAQLLGELQFLANATRPDIAFTVNRLSSYTANPTMEHVTALKRILRYLKGTKSYGIKYSNSHGNNDDLFQYFSLLHLFLLESYWICEESSGNDKIQ